MTDVHIVYYFLEEIFANAYWHTGMHTKTNPYSNAHSSVRSYYNVCHVHHLSYELANIC